MVCEVDGGELWFLLRKPRDLQNGYVQNYWWIKAYSDACASAVLTEAEVAGGVSQSFHAAETEANIEKLQRTCERRGLKINGKKTQFLAISTNESF